MVYQFPLPPLVIDAFLRENVGILAQWAASLSRPNNNVTFFNFLASHDGVGLLPAHGILEEHQLENMIEKVKQRGGLVSYKATPRGNIPYELNINYLDAISEKELDDATRAKKFLASQAIMLSLAGVPGIYVHSLIGSGNDPEGVKRTGMNRSINREKLSYDKTAEALTTKDTLRHMVYTGYIDLLSARKKSSAFHPSGRQKIPGPGTSVFPVLRISPDEEEQVLCLINIGSKKELFSPDALTISGFSSTNQLYDIITGTPFHKRTLNSGIEVEPYQVLFITGR
jgi:sucrose phosphorylase